jgi:hypothetical protein
MHAPIASKGVPPIDRIDYLGRFPNPLRIHPEVLLGAAGKAQAALEKFRGTQETPAVHDPPPVFLCR